MSTDPVRQESFWDLSVSPKWPIEKWLEDFHVENPREQRALLTKFGFHQSFFKRRFLPGAIVWGIVLAFMAWIWWIFGKPGEPNDYATAIAAMCAFVFGYYQWRSSRYEKSMEDFYSRLGLANERRESAKLVSKGLGHPWDMKGFYEYSETLCKYRDHRWSIYVYSELDNLEYVVEKYNLGYMQPRQALRGLTTFYQRCTRPAFRIRALKCVRCMAYNESTADVVWKICEHIENRREARLPRRSKDLPFHGDDRRRALRPRRSQDLAHIPRWRDLAEKAAL